MSTAKRYIGGYAHLDLGLAVRVDLCRVEHAARRSISCSSARIVATHLMPFSYAVLMISCAPSRQHMWRGDASASPTLTWSPTMLPPRVIPVIVSHWPTELQILCADHVHPPSENSGTRSPLGPRRRKGMFFASYSSLTCSSAIAIRDVESVLMGDDKRDLWMAGSPRILSML